MEMKTIHKVWLVMGIWVVFVVGPCPALVTAKSSFLPFIAGVICMALPLAAWRLWKEHQKEEVRKKEDL